MLFLIFTGCGKTTNQEVQTTQATENKLAETGSDVIKTYIQQKDKNDILNFSVESSFNIEGGLISVYRFYDQNNDEYEGSTQFDYINGSYSIGTDDHTKVDKSVPFTQHEMSGQYSYNNKKKGYFVISGIVNDDKISKINVNFNDGQLADITIDDNMTMYAYVINNDNAYKIGIQKITASDKNGNTVYQYRPG